MKERIQGEECVDGMQNGDATALLDHGGLLSWRWTRGFDI